jgi:hypothetical protein
VSRPMCAQLPACWRVTASCEGTTASSGVQCPMWRRQVLLLSPLTSSLTSPHLTSPSMSFAPLRRDIHYISSSGAVKRGSFKATQLQPRHQHEVATSAAAAAAAAAAENEEGGAAGSGGAFIAPLPPILGGQGAGGVRGELPEGMYFIGVGVFMMEVMQP